MKQIGKSIRSGYRIDLSSEDNGSRHDFSSGSSFSIGLTFRSDLIKVRRLNWLLVHTGSTFGFGDMFVIFLCRVLMQTNTNLNIRYSKKPELPRQDFDLGTAKLEYFSVLVPAGHMKEVLMELALFLKCFSKIMKINYP